MAPASIVQCAQHCRSLIEHASTQCAVTLPNQSVPVCKQSMNNPSARQTNSLPAGPRVENPETLADRDQLAQAHQAFTPPLFHSPQRLQRTTCYFGDAGELRPAAKIRECHGRQDFK